MSVEPDREDAVRCPKCGRLVESLCCGHCGSRLPGWQADLYGAAVRQLAKMGRSRCADAGNQGGSQAMASPSRITRPLAVPRLTEEERRRRTSLIHGDAVAMLQTLPNGIADLCLFDPPYPHIERPYGRLTETEWHDLMKAVLQECKRILKPHGSVVVILQSNYEKVGRMRLWSYDFVTWAARMLADWGLVEDAYSFSPNSLPSAGTARQDGLLRKAIKWCVWLGPADCYRNQDAVLQEPAEETVSRHRNDDRPARYTGGAKIRHSTFRRALEERGGVTPHNLLVVPTATPIDHQGHPAVTPYRLAEWWCRYLLPPDGVLIDPFCGSGTTLLAALNCGATRVIGIDKEADYLERARQRLFREVAETVVECPDEPSPTTDERTKAIAADDAETGADLVKGPQAGVRALLSIEERAALLRAGKQSPEHGIVYTPPGVAEFLHRLLCHRRPKIVLDVASGNGDLSRPWRNSAKVIEYELAYGKDFFDCPDHIATDLALCNPPFGEEKRFLRRILEVVPEFTPIVLVATHRVRLGSYPTSDDWRWCRDEWPPITSIVSLPRGVFRGVNETVEILIFRASGLLPHYFLSADVAEIVRNAAPVRSEDRLSQTLCHDDIHARIANELIPLFSGLLTSLPYSPADLVESN